MAELSTVNPIRQQIADKLRKEIIANYQPGDKLPSGHQLGKRFDVSQTTIQTALAELVREGLIESRRGSGTYVAEKIDTRHIAIYMEKDIADPRCSYFYRRCIQQLRKFFNQHNMEARLYIGSAPYGPRSEEPKYPTCAEFLEAVENDEIRGVVAVLARPHPAWIKPLERRSVPVVGNMNHEYGVTLDFKGIIHEATEYLLNQGRKNIALLTNSDPDDPPDRYRYMVKYFEKELEQRGLKANPDWIRWDLHPLGPTAGWCEFREIWTASHTKPDGLIITDDFLYQSAVQAILELGIDVPKQLKIISLSVKGSGLFLPVPTALLQINPDEAAQQRGNMLLQLLNGKPVPSGHKLLSFQKVDSAVHQNTLLTTVS